MFAFDLPYKYSLKLNHREMGPGFLFGCIASFLFARFLNVFIVSKLANNFRYKNKVTGSYQVYGLCDQ